MLSCDNVENMIEFVLHCLCSEDCFNMPKAAYFVDNIDFNCLKGIAGYNHLEKYKEPGIWSKPENFSSSYEKM